MAVIDQVLKYVKSINETLNLWAANAKKTEELPVMNPMNPEGLLIVSELINGIWTSKQLDIQKIIDGISLSGQDNKVREILLGNITSGQDLNYLLDNNGITVSQNEIIILTALATVNSTLVQKQYLWKLGKGQYNPIGSANISSKIIELQPKFLNEITADELTSSPSAIVYTFGTVTSILDSINNASPSYDYTDEEKIYYIRCTIDGVNLLYNFVGTNGIYGAGSLQMLSSDLVLVYSSINLENINYATFQYVDQKDTELSQRIDAIENGSSNEIPYKADFIATGSNDIELPLNVYAKNVFINKLPPYADQWSQTGRILSIATIESGDKVTVTGVESTTIVNVYKQDFISIGSQDFQLPPNIKAKNVFINKLPPYADQWSQTGDIVTITTAENNDKITITN
jgi:hypothetical protein